VGSSPSCKLSKFKVVKTLVMFVRSALCWLPLRPPRWTNRLGGWPSLGEKGHQEKGCLQSLHMRMHADVPARTHMCMGHVYICIHTRTYTRMRTHAHICTHAQVHNACTHVCTQTYTHTHTHVRNARSHVRACTHTYTHMDTNVHIRARTHTYACTRACICM